MLIINLFLNFFYERYIILFGISPSSDWREFMFSNEIKLYYDFWQRTERIYFEWAKSKGISKFTLYCLYSLYENENGCTQGEICDRWILPKQTVNTILKGFEDKGYVYFVKKSEDGRCKRVLLTDEGRAYADSIVGELNKIENNIFSMMGEDGKKWNELNFKFLHCLEDAVKGEF